MHATLPLLKITDFPALRPYLERFNEAGERGA